MNSEVLSKAREYEEKYDKFIAQSDRPVFHLTPRVGWMNDPNGFSVYKGKYHMFYQYHPYSTSWGPMHWGHAVSEDLFRWTYLPAAIAPDMPYDDDGCFSGSALELPDGRQMLIYTGVHREEQPDGSFRDAQRQCIAYGDGTEYEKYPGNPVIGADLIPEGFSTSDFRDPKIWREEDGSFACVTGNRNEVGGNILLFRSEDGVNWRFACVPDRSYGEYGNMWECPDFFRLDGKDVFLISPQNMSPLGLEFHNGNNTMCLIGSYDREKERFDREKVQAIDYGLDFYAPQTTLSPDGRRIMIGWLQNWDTCAAAPDARWFGQMSVPRELSIRDGRLIQMPVRELAQHRARKIAYSNIPLHEETSLQGIYGRIVDMTVTVEPMVEHEPYRMFRLRVARGSQHYTSISYYPETSKIKLDRSHAGSCRDFVHTRECLVRNQGGRIKLRVILDRNSVEVFINDGEQAMSAVIYTPMTADGISFECSGKAAMSVEKYELV